MSSTNKTTNYDLSQYIGSDKPTYLSDYNGDMYKIDAQMKVNADNVATAISSASTATSTANTAVSTANSASADASSALSTANSASTTAGNAQSTANSALSTATTAQTTANNALASAEAIAQKLNLTNFETISQSSTTVSGSGTITDFNVNTATNDDGSIGKIYGRIKINTNGSTGKIVFPTQLRPKDSQGVATDLTINGVCNMVHGETGNVKNSQMVSIVIKSNGNVEINYAWGFATADYNDFALIACVLFLTPFDDTPIPTPGE